MTEKFNVVFIGNAELSECNVQKLLTN